MTESFFGYYPTARDMINSGFEPSSPKGPGDANFRFSSDGPGRNLDASSEGRQKRGRSEIRIRRGQK